MNRQDRFEASVNKFNHKQANKLRREVLKADTKATRVAYGVESENFSFTFEQGVEGDRFARTLKLLLGSGARLEQIS